MIFYSISAQEYFEKLFATNFSDVEVDNLKAEKDAKYIINDDICEFIRALEMNEELAQKTRLDELNSLKEICKEENYNLLNRKEIRSEILNEYFIPFVPVHSYLQAFVAARLGYSIKINMGFSSTLSMKKDWFDMVKDVWKLCKYEVHPYQKGDTSQGTAHCATIVERLNELNKIEGFKLEEAVILLVSAAVHDIGKSLLANDDHVRVGHEFIESQFSVLKIQAAWHYPVCNIVGFHSGKNNLLDLPTSQPDFIVPDNTSSSGYTTLSNIDIQKLAAVFRLCDASDMTFTRMSDIIYSLNKSKKYYISPFLLDKLFVRNSIEKVTTNGRQFDVTIFGRIIATDRKKIEKSVGYDNDDLTKYNVKSILQNNTNLPFEFKIV